MASARQIEANRRNAKLGGPKTEEGKARVRFNALRHGLAAQCALLPHEDKPGFQELRAALLQDYAPENTTEELIVEELARAAWRLLRLREVEVGTWDLEIRGQKRKHGLKESPDPADARTIGVILAVEPPEHFHNYFRYQSGIERAYYRALHEAAAILDRRRRHALEQERLALQCERIGVRQPVAPAGNNPPPPPVKRSDTRGSKNGIGTVRQSPGSAGRVREFVCGIGHETGSGGVK